MRNGGSASFSLNPKGYAVDNTAAQDMIDSLNLVNDGRNTEILSAKSVLKDARKMHAELQELQTTGPEVTPMVTALKDAIENLQQTIERVD